MKKYCFSWLVLLTGTAHLLLVCGEGSPGMFIRLSWPLPWCHVVKSLHASAGVVFLSLGSTTITTNNTEIPVTEIGDDAPSGLPSLTCHTNLTACCRSRADSNGTGPLGQWTFPDGRVILNNSGSATAGEQFYVLKNAPQLIRLNRRQSSNSPSPTGSYCCTIPTTEGEMTFCANLGECISQCTDH